MGKGSDVQMMGSLMTLQRGKQLLVQLNRDSSRLQLVGYLLAGFFLSAAALNRDFQPIVMGFCCAVGSGWPGIAIALGGCTGYLVFWGAGAVQGLAWMIGGLLVGGFVADRPICARQKLLVPALAALIVAGCGVLFLFHFQDTTTIPAYLLRIASAVGAAAVFQACRQCPGTAADWLAQALIVLALAQVMPIRYLGLGYIAAGYLGATGGFPAAVLSGVALDLAQITRIPMTGALCLGFFLRLIPQQNRWFTSLCPALGLIPMAVLTGHLDMMPLPGMLLGGFLGGILPGRSNVARTVHRRGETAVAQVRLEQMAMIFAKMEQDLLICDPILDRSSVLLRAADEACDNCPERRQCKARQTVLEMPPGILEQPGLSVQDLPKGCRKQGRLLQEVRRGQEQLRRMKADRNRLCAYRTALREQYGYLSLYLQGLSDELAAAKPFKPARFEPDVGMSTQARQDVNGDLCIWFAGTGNKYYVLLCDGMGTGAEARFESEEATQYLRQMLTLGFPAEYALRSLNSMAVLREKGACATVDLLQIQLDSGKAELYKWGAAPSYVQHKGQLRKIGTAGPPPGLSQRQRETVDRLSLSGGEVLILLSDGAGEEMLLRNHWEPEKMSTGEMAANILEQGNDSGDDATAVVVRLKPSGLSTQ